MSCGLPVVATPSGGVQELITKANGAVSNGFDQQEVAQTILDVIERMSSFDRRLIREDVVKNFSLQSVGEQTQKMYDNVLSRYNTVDIL